MALDWAITCIIKEWITGNEVPYQAMGKNLEFIKVHI
jgi:hypothetical protein